ADELGQLAGSVNKMAMALTEQRHRDEVRAWQQLVRVLSHEINNTLAPVRAVAVMIRERLGVELPGEKGEELGQAFRLIGERVDALAAFIAGYAELSRLPAPERQLVDLTEIAHGAVRMLREQAAGLGVEMAVLTSEPVPALLDPTQIERAMINVIKNAVEAARQRVWVEIARSARGVELVIDDDGPGISAEARPQLFVPFFTTKPAGSGIGLALVRQIVLGHGGSVDVEARPGGGTRIRIALPRAGGSA